MRGTWVVWLCVMAGGDIAGAEAEAPSTRIAVFDAEAALRADPDLAAKYEEIEEAVRPDEADIRRREREIADLQTRAKEGRSVRSTIRRKQRALAMARENLRKKRQRRRSEARAHASRRHAKRLERICRRHGVHVVMACRTDLSSVGTALEARRGFAQTVFLPEANDLTPWVAGSRTTPIRLNDVGLGLADVESLMRRDATLQQALGRLTTARAQVDREIEEIQDSFASHPWGQERWKQWRKRTKEAMRRSTDLEARRLRALLRTYARLRHAARGPGKGSATLLLRAELSRTLDSLQALAERFVVFHRDLDVTRRIEAGTESNAPEKTARVAVLDVAAALEERALLDGLAQEARFIHDRLASHTREMETLKIRPDGESRTEAEVRWSKLEGMRRAYEAAYKSVYSEIRKEWLERYRVAYTRLRAACEAVCLEAGYNLVLRATPFPDHPELTDGRAPRSPFVVQRLPDITARVIARLRPR